MGRSIVIRLEKDECVGGLNMGQMDQNRDKVLCLFYNYPSKSFQIRELGRLSKVSKTTVQRILDDLVQEKIILSKRGDIYKNYNAAVYNWKYVFLKKNYFIKQVYESGLVDYVQTKLHPQAVILFGSGAKGDYVVESDIDIFVLGSVKEVDLRVFERKLKRNISLVIKESYTDLSAELFNNIINGAKLGGYIKIR